MSGECFDYVQYRLDEPLEKLKNIIEYQDLDDINIKNYSEETQKKIKEAYNTILKARIYLVRVAYLLDGDDGEEAFLSRTKAEMDKACFFK